MVGKQKENTSAFWVGYEVWGTFTMGFFVWMGYKISHSAQWLLLKSTCPSKDTNKNRLYDAWHKNKNLN